MHNRTPNNNRKIKILKTIAFLFLTITLFVFIWLAINPQYSSGNQPTTVFLHGYGSSAKATNPLASAAQQTFHIRNRLTIHINSKGKTDLNAAKISNNGNIIQFEFTDKETSEEDEAKYLADVLNTLKQRGVNTVNLVGHSMGANVSLRYVVTKQYSNTKYPKINKLVIIAAPFNTGIDQPKDIEEQFKTNSIDPSTGLPKLQDKNFKYFYKNRETISPNLKILNIYGDVGDHSDGVVTNFSTQSLNYFVNKKQPYMEMKITGNNVQHSKVRDNQSVVDQVASFLSRE